MPVRAVVPARCGVVVGVGRVTAPTVHVRTAATGDVRR